MCSCRLVTVRLQAGNANILNNKQGESCSTNNNKRRSRRRREHCVLHGSFGGFKLNSRVCLQHTKPVLPRAVRKDCVRALSCEVERKLQK